MKNHRTLPFLVALLAVVLSSAGCTPVVGDAARTSIASFLTGIVNNTVNATILRN